jgi:hypothetical protein
LLFVLQVSAFIQMATEDDAALEVQLSAMAMKAVEKRKLVHALKNIQIR